PPLGREARRDDRLRRRARGPAQAAQPLGPPGAGRRRTMTAARTGPLADLRILDLTQALAGPFCTMLLADLGADVVKIEPPQGDMSRALPPFPADREGCDYGGYFASINRNKRSVVLDLRAAADRDILLRLVDLTGAGQFLDVAMYDALVSLCESVVYNFSYAGRVLGPRGTGHPSLCPFDVFATTDGAVAIAAPTDNHWKLLCEAIGRPELAADARYDHNHKRVAAADEVRRLVAAWTGRHTRREVVAALGGKVPVGPVNTARDIFEEP